MTGSYFAFALIIFFSFVLFAHFVLGNGTERTNNAHLECVDYMCMWVDGPGDNFCLFEDSICGSSGQVCLDNDVLGGRLERFYSSAEGIGEGGTRDECVDGVLTEYYCGDSEEESIEYECPWGCSSGETSSSCAIINEELCGDIDGNNIFAAGCATKGSVELCDFCGLGFGNLGISVYEARCMYDGTLRYIETGCGGLGCVDGACGGGAHLECIDNQCRYVNGPGEDSCEGNYSHCN